MSTVEKLEISPEADALFNEVWSEFTKGLNEKELKFPKEILWLGGAPGAGKGTQTDFIMDKKAYKAGPVVTSDLLNAPELKKIKDSGALVGDREVAGVLFKTLLKDEYQNGVIVDGYPRTVVQAETIKLFCKKLQSISSDAPNFFTLALNVDEKVSVERQLHRGKTSDGEVRATDKDPEAALKRFKVFNELTFPALQCMKDTFPFYAVDASPSIEEVQDKISEIL